MMQNIQAKNYRNLLNLSIEIFNKLDFNESNIIATNCISLSAGLIFTLLKSKKTSFGLFYSIDELQKSNFKINFLLVNKNNIILENKITHYFEYIGDEENILCI